MESIGVGKRNVRRRPNPVRFLSALALGLAGLSSGPSRPADIVQPVPVWVALTGDDGLTQTLSSEIEMQIARRDDLSLASSPEVADFSISSDKNVSWDKIDGKTLMIYQVFFREKDKTIVSLMGVCFERKSKKCGEDIVGKFAKVIDSQARH